MRVEIDRLRLLLSATLVIIVMETHGALNAADNMDTTAHAVQKAVQIMTLIF